MKNRCIKGCLVAALATVLVFLALPIPSHAAGRSSGVSMAQASLHRIWDVMLKQEVSGEDPPAEIPVSSVTLSEHTLTLSPGQNSYLWANIEPWNATNQQLLWTTSDSAVCQVDQSGNLYAVGGGQCYITVYAQSSGKTDICYVTVSKPVSEIAVYRDDTRLYSGDSVTMKPGATETWSAVAYPSDATNAAITWSSSNPDVATVDQNGTVTAVAKGSTTIYAKSEDSGVQAYVNLTVTVPVESIRLSQTEVTLQIKSSVEVTATVLPEDANNKNIYTEVADTSIAKVVRSDNTLTIKGLSVGETTVTVYPKENQDIRAVITVKVQPILIQKITLEHTKLEVKLNKYRTVLATFEPGDATDKTLTWKSSDPAVATVEGERRATIYGHKAGKATITVTAVGGAKATCAVTVTKSGAGVVEVSSGKGTKADPYVIHLDKTDLTRDSNAFRYFTQIALNMSRDDSKHYYKIIIPKGTYKCNALVKIFSRTTIVATGATIYDVKGHNIMVAGEKTEVVSGYNGNVDITIIGGIWDGNGVALRKKGTKSSHCIGRFAHCTNLTFKNAVFTHNNGNHSLEMAACKNVKVDHCTFSNAQSGEGDKHWEALQIDVCNKEFGFYKGGAQFACEDVEVCNCTFSGVGEGVGSHSYSTTGHKFKNISIHNNTFKNFTKVKKKGYDGYAAVHAYLWHNSKVYNNKISGAYIGVSVTKKNPKLKVYGNTISGCKYAAINVTGKKGSIYCKKNKIKKCKKKIVYMGVH